MFLNNNNNNNDKQIQSKLAQSIYKFDTYAYT